MRQRLLVGLLQSIAFVVLLCSSGTASAYLSPQQVFGDAGSPSLLPVPAHTSNQATPALDRIIAPNAIHVNARSSYDQRTIEQLISKINRTQAQESLKPEPPAHSSAPDTGPTSLGLFDDQAQYQRRMDRLSQEQAANPTIIIQGGGNGTTVTDSRGRVVHSGAPLVTSTGLGSELAALALLLSAGGTVLFALRRTRIPAILR